MVASVEIVPETEKASTPQIHSVTKDEITPSPASDSPQGPSGVQPPETARQAKGSRLAGTRPIAGLPDSAADDSVDAISDSSAPVREQDGQVQVGERGHEAGHAADIQHVDAAGIVPQIVENETPLPPLDAKKMRSLRRSLLKFGQKYPILVDRRHHVIDGRHRSKLLEDLGITPWVVVVDDDDELANEALALSLDRHRREVSDKATAAQLREHQFANLLALREKDPKTWTQEVIADLMDISISTVSNWQNKRHILTGGTASKSDGRRQYTDEQKSEAVRLVREENKTVAQVAYEQVMSERGVRRALAEADRRAAANASTPIAADEKTRATDEPPVTGEPTEAVTDEIDDLIQRACERLGWDQRAYEHKFNMWEDSSRRRIEQLMGDHLGDDLVEELLARLGHLLAMKHQLISGLEVALG